jgi:hypothetical protein
MSKNLVVYDVSKLYYYKVISKRAKFNLLYVLVDYDKNYVIEYLCCRVS